MRFSDDVIAELKARLLRTKANDFKFTDAEAKDAASVTGLSVEQVQKWNQDVHIYYTPYEHEKETPLEKVEDFLSNTKVCLNHYNINIIHYQIPLFVCLGNPGHAKRYGKNVWEFLLYKNTPFHLISIIIKNTRWTH